jgi:hypothetical protein
MAAMNRTFSIKLGHYTARLMLLFLFGTVGENRLVTLNSTLGGGGSFALRSAALLRIASVLVRRGKTVAM